MTLPLEVLLTSSEGFGLTTATPVQRAICRASDGIELGELWDDPTVRQAFGGACPRVAPLEFVILAAIRCGKSLFSAAKAIQLSQTCDVSPCVGQLRPGEYPRIPVVSTSKDNAQIVFDLLVGALREYPALKPLMIGAPTEERERKLVMLRHPSGIPIEVRVSPIARAGAALVGRWLAGAIFDEAPRMAGADEGVLNLDDARKAILGRILPGGQIWYPGSPWAPYGPVYEMTQEHFGRPNRDVVVVRARGPQMNPYYWTPERCETLRRQSATAYRTDVEGEFADPEQAMFPSALIERATRRAPERLERQDGWHYTAAMDPATRGNAWPLVVVGCKGFGGVGGATLEYTVALAHQWLGSSVEPLRPRQVLAEIAPMVREYGLDTVMTDQYSVDALADLADDVGLALHEIQVRADNRLDMLDTLRLHLQEWTLELAPEPHIRTDLIMVKRRVTANGVTAVFPRSAGGRHCDFALPLAMSLVYPPDPPDAPEQVVNEDLERAKADVLARVGGDMYESAVRTITS